MELLKQSIMKGMNWATQSRISCADKLKTQTWFKKNLLVSRERWGKLWNLRFMSRFMEHHRSKATMIGMRANALLVNLLLKCWSPIVTSVSVSNQAVGTWWGMKEIKNELSAHLQSDKIFRNRLLDQLLTTKTMVMSQKLLRLSCLLNSLTLARKILTLHKWEARMIWNFCLKNLDTHTDLLSSTLSSTAPSF